MTATLNSGIDLTHVDADTRPQDDLFGHVNGRWLVDHVMPADRATDGAFRLLADRAEEQVRDLITEAAAGQQRSSDPDHQQDDNSRDPDDSSKAPRNGPTGGCPDVVRSFGRSLTIGDLEIRDGNRLESARLVRGRRGGSSHGSYSGSAQRYVLTPNSPSVPWSHISRSRSSMTLAMHPGSNERSDGATAYQESILEDRCQKEIAVQAQGRAPYTDN